MSRPVDNFSCCYRFSQWPGTQQVDWPASKPQGSPTSTFLSHWLVCYMDSGVELIRLCKGQITLLSELSPQPMIFNFYQDKYKFPPNKTFSYPLMCFLKCIEKMKTLNFRDYFILLTE